MTLHQLSQNTCASGPMFHSVIGTRSIENTIIRFRGSFSPSKYAINRERKSGFESCSVRKACSVSWIPLFVRALIEAYRLYISPTMRLSDAVWDIVRFAACTVEVG